MDFSYSYPEKFNDGHRFNLKIVGVQKMER